MNIQIFGTKKCNDTKKAERFFKERGIKYTVEEDRLEKVLDNPSVIKTPVVRNGKLSTLGYQPDVWKTWS